MVELKKLAKEEMQLITRLKEAREKISKKESEFLLLEGNLEAKKKKEIEAKAIREKDVLEGRKSMRDFFLKGRREGEIAVETVESVTKEMEELSDIIRAENLRILLV